MLWAKIDSLVKWQNKSFHRIQGPLSLQAAVDNSNSFLISLNTQIIWAFVLIHLLSGGHNEPSNPSKVNYALFYFEDAVILENSYHIIMPVNFHHGILSINVTVMKMLGGHT